MNTSTLNESTSRFKTLFSIGAAKVKDPTVRKLENCAFELRVLKGMHIGATQTLTAAVHTVGASSDSDCILLDLGDTALRLERSGARYLVYSSPFKSPLGGEPSPRVEEDGVNVNELTDEWIPVSAAEHYERSVKSPSSGEVSSTKAIDRDEPDRFEMCDVYVFESAAFEIATIADAPSLVPSGDLIASKHRLMTKVVCVTAFFAVSGIVYAISAVFSKDEAANAAVRGNVALAQSAFSNVHSRRAIDGGTEFAGIVSDEKELNSLISWAQRNGFQDVRMRVLRLDQFRERLRESLSGADVKVQTTPNGVLRVEGTVKSPILSERLNAIIKEIGNAASIENRLVISPDKAAPIASGLPFRVATLKPGRPGYVEIEGGLRYFEGSVTAEGYEVVRVDASSARFARAGRELVYSLN
jgi:hypothetical protein